MCLTKSSAARSDTRKGGKNSKRSYDKKHTLDWAAKNKKKVGAGALAINVKNRNL